jgi:hypothetical protein
MASAKNMALRQAFVDNCLWGAEHHAQFNYAEIRPIPIHLPRRTSSKITTDCSGFVTLMAKWAGLPDPNGLGYNGEGYTGSLLHHLSHIPFHETWRGDLCVYGTGTGTHVVALSMGGVREANPIVYSHGQQGGPFALTLNAESAYHSGQPRTYLRIVAG